MLPETISADREAGVPHQDLARAAARFGTPVYVISMADVTAAAGRLEDVFGAPWLRLYSLKANDLPAITSFLHGRGWGASVVSTGEWQHAAAAGVPNESVAFEGLGKTDAQLAFTVGEAVAGRPVRWLAVESAQEAAVLAGLAEDAGLGVGGLPPLDVLLRLNPEVAPETRPEFAVGARLSKFGMSQGEILRLVQGPSLAGPGLRLRGIHVHVGSDLGDVRAFSRAGVRATQLLAGLRVARPRDRRWLDTIDFGGGFPLPVPGAPAPESFRDALARALDRAGLELPPRPAIEPGRYLVGAAGWLVARVLHTRTAGAQAQQVVLDAGMTELIRPALYGSSHPVHLLRASGPAAACGDGAQVDAPLTLCWTPRWRDRCASRPTRSAGTRCRRCTAATSSRSGTPVRTAPRSRPATTAGPRPWRRCYGPAACCSDAAALGPWSRPDARPKSSRRSRIPIPPADRREPPVMHLSTGRKRPRLTALCGTAVIVLGASLLAACSSSGTSAQSNGQVAIVPTQQGSTADDIFPIVSGPQITPFNQQDFQWLMYRPLYWYGGQPGNEFGLYQQISLAYPPVYSDNDTVITVKLKKYYWSDGTPVTARDVTFFVNLIKANKDYWGYYTPGEFPDNVKSVQAVNSSTVRFTLTRSFSPQWYNASELSEIIPLPQHVWDKTSASGKVGNYDETAAGAVSVFKYLLSQAQSVNTYASNPLWQVVNGPFRLKSYSTRGDIVLVPNKHYSGTPKPRLKELIERPFTSPTAEFNSLLAGTGLTEGSVPSQDDSQIPALKAAGYRVFNTLTYGFNYVVINFNSPNAGYLFRQLYIRQALQHLVDQPQDVKFAYHGNATASYGPVPLAPTSPFTTSYERSNPYPFSVADAESLLRSHGWAVHSGGTDTCAKPGTGPSECGAGIPAGKALKFKILYASGDPGYQVMMENFQSDARSAGITLELSQGQFNQITGVTGVCAMGSKACNWDGVMYGGTTMDIYPTGNGMFNTDANGQGNYSSSEANQLINATEYEPGLSHFYTYENYISQQLPFIFMPWEQVGINNVVAKNLTGFTADEDNPFADTFPENWYFSK